MLKAIAIMFLIIIVIRLVLRILFRTTIRTFSNINTSDGRDKRNREDDYTSHPDSTVKKFKKEEGEYISYEEVKDEE